MDFLDGPTLATHVRRSGVLPHAEVVSLGLGVARGLAAIHEAALLHRDLKPDNVMLVRGRGPVITDLGVAKLLREEALTMSGALVGTPLYMSPEQASGEETTQATDLYSLGAILYECLSGSPPLRAPDLVSLLVAVRTRAPEPLPHDVPRPLADLVFRLLRKEAADRPQDAADVAAELESIAAALRA
jgi:serine/threonine-protein kinase